MTSLSQHQSDSFIKLVYIGDSGTGKTGSLASLACAGYKLRILDYDNGLDALKAFIRQDCAGALDNVDFETLRDAYKATASGPVCRSPKAFVNGHKLMEQWSDGTDPSEWGADTIFVLDSGTSFGKAGFEWARGMNPTAKDPRQWYFSAQQAFENTIALLTSEAFHCNVIVISHITYKEMQDGTTKGHPSAIGSALGPTIARYFNTIIEATSRTQGKNTTRTIRTIPTSVLDLKNPAPFSIDAELPLATGMATLFEKLKGGVSQEAA